MTIQELLKDLDVDFLESGHHHCRPGWIQLKHCVFCKSDNYHLGVNVAGLFAACWRCGGHSLYNILDELGVDRIKDTFRGLKRDYIPRERPKRTKLKEPAGRGPLLKAHLQYLEDRGFNPDKIQRLWHIEGIGRSSRLSWRIYIPILHRETKVSWTTRAIGDRVSQRYVSASAEEEAVNHKELIYGLDYCVHSIVIVEGPTDAWAVGPGAGALFGTAFTTAQLNKLSRIPNRFVCFDSSPPAQRKALGLTLELSAFPGATQNIVLDAKDPGSATPKELRLLRKAARL